MRNFLKAIPFVVFGLIGIAPILLSMGAGLVARIYGCELHEGSPPDDSDFSRMLYRLGAAGW
jgi:hypothetical protein